jgi:hypothetical protein
VEWRAIGMGCSRRCAGALPGTRDAGRYNLPTF